MFPFSTNFDSDLSLLVALAPSVHFQLTNASHSTSSIIFLLCHFLLVAYLLHSIQIPHTTHNFSVCSDKILMS